MTTLIKKFIARSAAFQQSINRRFASILDCFTAFRTTMIYSIRACVISPTFYINPAVVTNLVERLYLFEHFLVSARNDKTE